jgi:DNA-directed RNA polymerase subunit RPC12/RpoP
MDFVLRNPFRVLGLPVTASSREIAKRVSDLELFAELGKEKTFPNDFPDLGDIDRSMEAIKDAARRIELPEMRVLHSFFWFRDGDAVDELAFECLNNFDLRETDDVWTKQLEKNSGIGKVSWRINRGAFSIWMAGDLDDSGTVYFEQALQDVAFACEDLYDEATTLIPGASQVSAQRVRELIADALIEMAVRSSEQVYGPNAIRVTEHCSYFHDQTLEYIASKITKPLTNAIQDAVDRSKAKRAEGTSIDDLRRKNGLSKVEHIIYELRDSLGETDPSFQAVANSFADEVIACAINAINSHKTVPTALVLAEWAAELPSYGQTRKWLLEQRGKIFTWDPDYVSEDAPDEDLTDIKTDLESDEEEEEIEQTPPPKRIPTESTICPGCSKQFEPDEVVEYTDFGVRCPHCRQSIVL